MSRLGELTTLEVGACCDRVLVVPAGSCEQHGPHLPLDTDTRIAQAVCDGVAANCGEVFVAPALAVGASGEHAGFAGTLSIGTDVLSDVVVELVRSADGFRGVLIVNAHGGNTRALAKAAALCQEEGRPTVVHNVGFPGADAHAGRSETSIMLAIEPGLVRPELAVPGELTELDELMPRLCAEGVAGVSPTGILGDPTGANAAEGRALLRHAVDDARVALELFEPGGPL